MIYKYMYIMCIFNILTIYINTHVTKTNDLQSNVYPYYI